MPTNTPTDSSRAGNAPSVSAEFLEARLAEAASYAVLHRIAPALRHDVAGFMQPVGMLVMVLQRRAQMPEPDLQAISKNVMSVSALAKEATTGCMHAMDWMASRDDVCVSLVAGVEEIVHLLALELSGRGLSASQGMAAGVTVNTTVNTTVPGDMTVDGVHLPRRFFRSVLAGALLAWCDQTPGAGMLRISSASDADETELKLQFEADGTALPTEVIQPQRLIGWDDVEALASACSATVSRGDGWLCLRRRHAVRAASNEL